MRERVTGDSVYQLTEAVDGGPVLAQEACLIRPADTPTALWRRELGPLALRLFERVLVAPAAYLASATPQNDALATWEPAVARPPLRAPANGVIPGP